MYLHPLPTPNTYTYYKLYMYPTFPLYPLHVAIHVHTPDKKVKDICQYLD